MCVYLLYNATRQLCPTPWVNSFFCFHLIHTDYNYRRKRNSTRNTCELCVRRKICSCRQQWYHLLLFLCCNVITIGNPSSIVHHFFVYLLFTQKVTLTHSDTRPYIPSCWLLFILWVSRVMGVCGFRSLLIASLEWRMFSFLGQELFAFMRNCFRMNFAELCGFFLVEKKHQF